MELSIIIASWNVQEHLRRCLKSIFDQAALADYEVIVIDNASRDQSAQMVLNEFPRVKLIVNEKNLGFASAVNQGGQVSRGDYLLLLNPDTELKSDSLIKLLLRAKTIDKLAVLGGRLLNPDGTPQPSVRRFPTLFSQCLIILKLHHWFGQLKVLRNYFAQDFDYDKEQGADQVMGAYFLIPREAWRQLGGLDGKFFVWFEEVDFCYRAKQAGLKVIYTPTGAIVHYGGESFKKVMGIHRQVLFNRSLRYYYKKREDWRSYFLLIILQPLSLLIALITQILINPTYKPKPRPIVSNKDADQRAEKMFKLK